MMILHNRLSQRIIALGTGMTSSAFRFWWEKTTKVHKECQTFLWWKFVRKSNTCVYVQVELEGHQHNVLESTTIIIETKTKTKTKTITNTNTKTSQYIYIPWVSLAEWWKKKPVLVTTECPWSLPQQLLSRTFTMVFHSRVILQMRHSKRSLHWACWWCGFWSYNHELFQVGNHLSWPQSVGLPFSRPCTPWNMSRCIRSSPPYYGHVPYIRIHWSLLIASMPMQVIDKNEDPPVII